MKNLYEIFDEVVNAEDRNTKIMILRNNGNYALRSVLKGIYNPAVQFTVERVPYYKPSDAPAGLGYTSIHQELGRAYLFEKNHPRVPPNLSEARKEQILIQILEALEKREAEIFMSMLLKKPIKGIDTQMVSDAFPDIMS